jgi:hypothetical protein
MSKGIVTNIDVPGEAPGGTFPAAINPQGDIVGEYIDTSFNQHGFLLSNGTFTTIDAPGSTFTAATGINPQGDILGIYQDSISLNLHGFLLSKGKFSTIDVPAAVGSNSQPFGINPQGDIVGYYTDSGGITHGFLLKRDREDDGDREHDR